MTTVVAKLAAVAIGLGAVTPYALRYVSPLTLLWAVSLGTGLVLFPQLATIVESVSQRLAEAAGPAPVDENLPGPPSPSDAGRTT
jgi:hypothetical protein